MSASVYEIKPSPGKGLGMFALRDIDVGELVASESPLVIATPFRCESSVALLSADQKAIFYALTDVHDPDSPSPLGIFRTNALPLSAGSTSGRIFQDICRVNHSCNPNVHHSWNAKEEKETIHAIRPIKPGEEILTAYIHPAAARSRRQSSLLSTFHFTCTCEACSAPPDPASDIRRAKLAELDDTTADVGARNFVLGFKYAKERIRQLDAEGLADQSDKGRSYYDAFQMCVLSLDFGAAKRQAGLAYGSSLIAEGRGSDNTLNYEGYWRNPKSHPNARIGSKKKIPMLCDG